MEVKTARPVDVRPFEVFGRHYLVDDEDDEDEDLVSSLRRHRSDRLESSGSGRGGDPLGHDASPRRHWEVRYASCFTPEGHSEGEHELHFSGTRVVWSIGGLVRQTLDLQHEIVDCNWACFLDEENEGGSSSNNNNLGGRDSLCVLTREGFTSYCGGEAFTISLPMSVERIWRLCRGLLLQEAETSKIWFLGSSLSELTEVAIGREDSSAISNLQDFSTMCPQGTLQYFFCYWPTRDTSRDTVIKDYFERRSH